MNLIKNVDIDQVAVQSSASTFLSAVVDLNGAEGCLFIAIGSSLLEGSTKIKLGIQGSTASGGTYVDYDTAGWVSSTAPVTGSTARRVFALDLYKPLKQYAKGVIAGASSGAIYLSGMVAIKYGIKRPGSTTLNDSTKLAGSTLNVSPTSS